MEIYISDLHSLMQNAIRCSTCAFLINILTKDITYNSITFIRSYANTGTWTQTIHTNTQYGD